MANFSLCVFGNPYRCASLEPVNHAHPAIKFTMEVENDGMLPFLGIQLLNRAPRIETKVFVKPTWRCSINETLRKSTTRLDCRLPLCANRASAHEIVSRVWISPKIVSTCKINNWELPILHRNVKEIPRYQNKQKKKLENKLYFSK